MMDALFLACLMGICGLPEAPARPDAVAQVVAAAPLAGGERRVNMTTAAERPVPQVAATTSPIDTAAEPGKLSRAVITDVVERQLGGVKRCYERALVEDETFTGTLEVGWKIQMDGSVSAASLIDASRHNTTAEDCLLAEVMRWQFPASSEPTAVGVYPFVLDTRLLIRHAARRPPRR